MSPTSTRAAKVVIVGGGFGGLAAARALRSFPLEVVLIDRRNFHLFQPLLYQVATGGLSPANIATPFRWTLRRQDNVDVVLGEVTGFDVMGRRVLKTIEDATEIRSRVLLAFGQADRESDAQASAALLTFVIAGAGPTGVELAGALGEISRHTQARFPPHRSGRRTDPARRRRRSGASFLP